MRSQLSGVYGSGVSYSISAHQSVLLCCPLAGCLLYEVVFLVFMCGPLLSIDNGLQTDGSKLHLHGVLRVSLLEMFCNVVVSSGCNKFISFTMSVRVHPDLAISAFISLRMFVFVILSTSKYNTHF